MTRNGITLQGGGCLWESSDLLAQGYSPDQLHCLLTYWILGFSSVTLVPDYSMVRSLLNILSSQVCQPAGPKNT